MVDEDCLTRWIELRRPRRSASAAHHGQRSSSSASRQLTGRPSRTAVISGPGPVLASRSMSSAGSGWLAATAVELAVPPDRRVRRRAARDLPDRQLGQLAERLRLAVGKADELGGLVPQVFGRHAAPVPSLASLASGRPDGVLTASYCLVLAYAPQLASCVSAWALVPVAAAGWQGRTVVRT